MFHFNYSSNNISRIFKSPTLNFWLYNFNWFIWVKTNTFVFSNVKFKFSLITLCSPILVIAFYMRLWIRFWPLFSFCRYIIYQYRKYWTYNALHRSLLKKKNSFSHFDRKCHVMNDSWKLQASSAAGTLTSWRHRVPCLPGAQEQLQESRE